MALQEGEVALNIYERSSGRMRAVLKGIDLNASAMNRADRACRWTDATHLICIMFEDGQPTPAFGAGLQFAGGAIARVEAAWAKAKRGEESASAVEVGRYPLPQRRLVRVDVVSGKVNPLTRAQGFDSYGIDTEGYWPSGDGQTIAYALPDRPADAPSYERSTMGAPGAIGLIRSDGFPVPLKNPLPETVLMHSIQWSPDSASLSFFVRERPDVAMRLMRVDLASGHLREIPTRGLTLEARATMRQTEGTKPRPQQRAPLCQWTQDGGFIVEAVKDGAGGTTRAWMLLRGDGSTQDLSALLPGHPMRLFPVPGQAAVLGIAGGDVWRIDTGNLVVTNLTHGRIKDPATIMTDWGAGKVLLYAKARSDVRLPDPERANGPIGPAIGANAHGLWVLQNGAASTRDYVLDPVTGDARELARPAIDAAILASGGGTAAYFAENRQGTHLWRATTSSAEELASLNGFWREIITPQRRLVDYQGLDGQKLKMLVQLPIGYQPGKRYPVVIDSDIGYTIESAPNVFVLDDTAPPGEKDGDVFGANGYVYVFASMPTRSGLDEIGRNNLLMFTHGLLPAAQAVVDMGIGDPDRLFLFGQSSMGFGVMGTITQTSRFRAAAASIGWADQTTIPFSMGPDSWYSENPLERMTEGAPYMDARLPPWTMAELVRRNSPMSYVDRVQTPLLILDGDFDHGYMENSREFFMALAKQKKPARYVRFWGEAHGNKSAPNIRRFWQEVFAWFDRWSPQSVR